MDILIVGMICYFCIAFIFLVYSIILLFDLHPLKMKWKKNVTYPFRKFLIRQRKFPFVPNSSMFIDTLKLQYNVEYHISIQTNDNKWYYNAILWIAYDGQFLIKVFHNDKIIFPKLNTITYISFHSNKVNKKAKKALELNLYNQHI